MASSQKASKARSRRLQLLIPLLGLVLVVAIIALSVVPMAPKTAAVDFQSSLVIEVHNRNNETLVSCVYPKNDVGVVGGFWYNHTLDKYGVDSHYPVFATIPTSIGCPQALPVEVKSTTVRNYTMGDFFSVWGQPIGLDNTIGLAPSQGMFWVMCVGRSASSLQPGNWGEESLVSNQTYILAYTRVTGCH
jgi:hypothetical protein